MPRRSTIEKLPKEVKDKIAKLRNGGRTIDEIMEVLDTLDLKEDVSRSSLGRYLKRQEQLTEKIRQSRLLANAVARDFGDKETSRVTQANIELMHSILLKIMLDNEGDGEAGGNIAGKIDAKEGMFLASAIEKLVKASKLDTDREVKIREEERRLATENAADQAEAAAKAQGLSEDTINAIKEKILGV